MPKIKWINSKLYNTTENHYYSMTLLWEAMMEETCELVRIYILHTLNSISNKKRHKVVHRQNAYNCKKLQQAKKKIRKIIIKNFQT